MGIFVLGLLAVATLAVNTRLSFPQLEMDQAIPFDQYSVGYDCASVHLSYILAVCSLCQATVAYTVFHGETDYLTGVYAEQREMLGRAVDDVQVRLPVANYTMAFVGKQICIAAHEFEGRPNFQLLFSYFSQVQPQEIQVPELFNLRGKTELDYIAVRTQDTSEAYQYEGFTISYKADDTAEVAKELVLSLEEMTIRVEEKSASLFYTGTAKLPTFSTSFSLVVPYDRSPRTPFSISLIPLSQFTSLSFTTLIDPISNCEGVTAIPGISALSEMSVELVSLTFVYRTENNAAELIQIVEFHQAPDLAVMPLISLTGVYSEYQIDYRTHDCKAIIAGSAEYTYPMKLQVIADGKGWYVEGGVDEGEITVGDIEGSFYKDFFLGFGKSLLPVYDQDANEDYITYFRALSLSRYSLHFSTTPVFSLEISGFSSWGGNPNTVTQVLLGWVNGVVESVVVQSVRGRNDFVTGDDSIVVVESRMVAATADIDLQAFPFMRGEGNQGVNRWQLGMTAMAKLAPGATCDTSQFCSMLARNSASLAQFTLTGSVINNQLNIRSPFPGVLLAANLTFSEAELVMDVTTTMNKLYVEGGFVIQAEGNEILRFAGNITNSGGSAVLESRSEVQWESPMGMDRISIGTLEARGYIDRDQGLINSSIRGPAVIGWNCLKSFDEARCVLGTVEVSLNPGDFRFNAYTVRVSGMELRKFVGVMVGLEVDSSDDLSFAVRGLDVSSSLDIIYPALSGKPGISLIGPVSYFGITSWMEASTPSIGSRSMDIYLDMDEFYMGSFNLWVRRSKSGELGLRMVVDDSGRDTTATIRGRMQFWNDETELEMGISEMGMRATFSASPGLQFYAIAFSLESNATFASLTDADLLLQGSISTDQLSVEQSLIRTDLQFWIQQGVEALDTLDTWKDNSTMLRAVGQSHVCPDEFCPEQVNCVTAPSASCVLHAQSQSCSQLKSSCVSPVLACAQTKSMCVASTAKCITVDNSVCIDWISICDVMIEVCTEWTEECGEKEERSCGTYEVREDEESCLEYETTCETGRYTNQGCLSLCEQNLATFTTMSSLSDLYRSGYDSAVPNLLGFRSMSQQLSYQGYGSDLFAIISFEFESRMEEAGLGVQDFDYRVEFATFVAGRNEEIVRQEVVPWSFVDRELNELSLLRAVKRVLIENSEETLSIRLVTRTPLEVALESLYPGASP